MAIYLRRRTPGNMAQGHRFSTHSADLILTPLLSSEAHSRRLLGRERKRSCTFHLRTHHRLCLPGLLAPLNRANFVRSPRAFSEIMSQRPTIILVHGAFHQPEHFDEVAKHLNGSDFRVVRPRLPSVGMASDPGSALHLDAGTVRDALDEVVIQQRSDAVLVMHSYGGLAGSEGYGMFQEGLAVAPSAESPQVRRLVYLAAHGPVERGTVFLPEDTRPPHLSIDV